MASVKFDHRVKYNRQWHPAHTAFDVKDDDLPQLVKLGAHVLSRGEKPKEEDPDKDTTQTQGSGENSGETGENSGNNASGDEGEDPTAALKEELLSYKVDELIAFAQKNDIDLKGKTRKSDIYNIIVASL